MWFPEADHPLRRYFSGLTEHAFVDDLGVADPPLIDYLALLLSRFVHIDAIARFQAGRTSLEQVADMLLEAEEMSARRAHLPRGASPRWRFHPVLDRHLPRAQRSDFAIDAAEGSLHRLLRAGQAQLLPRQRMRGARRRTGVGRAPAHQQAIRALRLRPQPGPPRMAVAPRRRAEPDQIASTAKLQAQGSERRQAAGVNPRVQDEEDGTGMATDAARLAA